MLAIDALRAEGAQTSALKKEEKKRLLDGMARVALRKQPRLFGPCLCFKYRISYLPHLCWTKNLRLPYVKPWPLDKCTFLRYT